MGAGEATAIGGQWLGTLGDLPGPVGADREGRSGGGLAVGECGAVADPL